MSVVMFVVGALTAVAGLVLVAAGIPVKEFSFGNTLIVSGTTAITGGLIIVGLGALNSQLQRIADMLGARPATRTDRSPAPFDAGSPRLGAGPGQIPFPPKTKMSQPNQQEADSAIAAPEHEEAPDTAGTDHLPPILRNPESVEPDETPLMPRQTPPASPSRMPEPPRSLPPLGDAGGSGGGDWRAPSPPPARPPQPNYFDAMWPSDSRAPKAPEAEAGRHEPPMRDTVMRESVARETAAPRRHDAAKPAAETRPVPVLKSGVIDGMGYTLYVDGSIEAELPGGTVRFGSIGELREHLENSA